jgi:hypothetical protein
MKTCNVPREVGQGITTALSVVGNWYRLILSVIRWRPIPHARFDARNLQQFGEAPILLLIGPCLQATSHVKVVYPYRVSSILAILANSAGTGPCSLG